MKLFFIFIFVILLTACSANTEQAPAGNNDEVTVKVNGAVCGFCSYGIRKEISKLPFVDTSQYEEGILTNSDEQSVTISILPGEEVDEDKLREIVIDAGYETITIEYNDE